jgi:hypothetical protein
VTVVTLKGSCYYQHSCQVKLIRVPCVLVAEEKMHISAWKLLRSRK